LPHKILISRYLALCSSARRLAQHKLDKLHFATTLHSTSLHFALDFALDFANTLTFLDFANPLTFLPHPKPRFRVRGS
jgi:hypothetical protein